MLTRPSRKNWPVPFHKTLDFFKLREVTFATYACPQTVAFYLFVIETLQYISNKIEFTAIDKNKLTDQETEKLVAVAKGCPVAQSLRSDLIQEVKFNF